jgi:8-oxo-dGTP pyrophosphatase MutT (NUDIX family)
LLSSTRPPVRSVFCPPLLLAIPYGRILKKKAICSKNQYLNMANSKKNFKYIIAKIYWFLVNPFKKLYWFIVRPRTYGVKCLIEKDGKFLLVKLNYAHHKWTIPGGGVKKGEQSLDAAIREAKEETGLGVVDLVFVGSYISYREYKEDMVDIYLGKPASLEIKIDPIEIKDAKWFNRNEFPVERSYAVDKVFNLYDTFRLNKN